MYVCNVDDLQIIPKYMTLLDSDNYVTRRQALKVGH